MIFKHKKSKITVDCFTCNQNAYNFYPIQKASKAIPEWWRTLKSHNNVDLGSDGFSIGGPMSTVKGCQGLLNLYRVGLVIPMWSQLIFEANEQEYRFIFADREGYMDEHGAIQLSKEFDAYYNTKIISPWYFKEKTGVSFLWQQPSWNHIPNLTNYHILPGSMTFRYQYATHINIMWKKNQRVMIDAGTPMAHLIPMSDKEVEIKMHYMTRDELGKHVYTANSYPWFTGAYARIKSLGLR